MKCFLSPRRDTRLLSARSLFPGIRYKTLHSSSIHSDVRASNYPREIINTDYLLSRAYIPLRPFRSNEYHAKGTQGMIFVYSSNDVDKFYLFETRSSVETEARFIFDKECHLAHGREEYPAACCRLPTYLSTYLPLTIGEICSPKAPHLSSWDHLR